MPEVFFRSRSYSAWAFLSAAACAFSIAACCLAYSASAFAAASAASSAAAASAAAFIFAVRISRADSGSTGGPVLREERGCRDRRVDLRVRASAT